MRLLTRSDFDGLACGTLLVYLGLIDEWKFVQPQEIQDGLVKVTGNDILANIPYMKGCKLWFDHHSSEPERLGVKAYFEGVSRKAPSCARVIYDYYGGDAKLGRFAEMVYFVDKVDSGQLVASEILEPQGWVLLGFIMDPRTGLERFGSFAAANHDVIQKLAHAFIDKDINAILAMPDIQERIQVYREQSELFRDMVTKHARVEGNALVVDLRDIETIYAGNRFFIYTLFPEQNISMWITKDRTTGNVFITAGHSIINRSAVVDIGSLMLRYGGGGHHQVGTCHASPMDAGRILAEIIEKIK